MEQKDIYSDVVLDDDTKSSEFIQDFIDTFSRLSKECGDCYPMILFPTELIKELAPGLYDRNEFVSYIMDKIVTQYGKDPETLKRDWDLYRYMPSEPILSIPSKKKEPIKREISTYTTKRVENERPSRCLWFIIIINIIVFAISIYSSDILMYCIFFTMVLPWSIWFIFQDPERLMKKKSEYIHIDKSKKQIEEERKKADEEYQKQLAEVERWNKVEWPKLVYESETKYSQEIEEFLIKKEKCDQYWRNSPRLIDNEFPRAFIKFIWNKINFSVEYNEEENPRRGSTEDRMLESLKKIGVKKLYRDISVKDYYPDFSIIDEYYFVDIEIDEPYIYDTNEPIHYIGSGDEERNKDFQDLGAFVIRFTEDQVRHSINICSKIVLLIQKFAETGNFLHLAEALDLSAEIRQKRWSFKKAQIMATYKYREK